MITRMDADIGRLFDTLRELGIDDNTLVLFTSDNGPQPDRHLVVDRFHPAGPLRGMKRDLYEGGIRVPLIARWPGKVNAGTTSDWVGYFGDVFATLCELTKQPVPNNLDSISMMPTLTGNPAETTTARISVLGVLRTGHQTGGALERLEGGTHADDHRKYGAL